MRRLAALLAAISTAALLTGPSFDAPEREVVEATAVGSPRPFLDVEERLRPPTTTTSSTTPPTTTTAPPPPPTTTTTTSPPPPAPPPPSGPCGGLEGALAAHFPGDVVPEACSVIRCETGGTFSPTAKNPSSSASGLFQFLDSRGRAPPGPLPRRAPTPSTSRSPPGRNSGAPRGGARGPASPRGRDGAEGWRLHDDFYEATR